MVSLVNDGEVSPRRTGQSLNFKNHVEMAMYVQDPAHDIQYVDACFCDPFGQWHHMTFTASQCEEKDLLNGWAFDGSSIRLFKSIEDSDMIMIPDPKTCFIDPFPKHQVMHVTCDVWENQSTPFDRCPRSILKKAVAAVTKEMDIADHIVVGPEMEFFCFNDVKFKVADNESSLFVDTVEGSWNTGTNETGGNFANRPMKKQFYAPTFPIDAHNDVRADMLKCLSDIGVPAEKHHHEVASGQHELGVTCSDACGTADNCMMIKYVVKNVAALNNLSASFMPKPLANDNGSGMHCHFSLWKDGKNLFYDPNGNYKELSQTCLYYIGGVLKHANAILAFCCPTVNSYKRLVPGYEAPSILSFSGSNRSACIRIPAVPPGDSKAKRIEFRCPDTSCCPYLAIASIILAGVDGIENKILPPCPLDASDPTGFSDQTFGSTPNDLRESLGHLQGDHEFLTRNGAFSEDFINSFIDHKMKEFNAIVNVPTPKEFQHYYHI